MVCMVHIFSKEWTSCGTRMGPVSGWTQPHFKGLVLVPIHGGLGSDLVSVEVVLSRPLVVVVVVVGCSVAST